MYSYNAIVRYSETQGNKSTSPASIANYFQDCAILHSEAIGKGVDYLLSQKRAWFMVYCQFDVKMYPCIGDKIKVSTWAYDFKGSMGFRNLVIFNEAGISMANAATIWSLVDTDNTKPIKVTEEMADAYGMEDKLDMEYTSRKIKLLDNFCVLDSRKVMNYQIDSNKHMNNEAYIALAQEYLQTTDNIWRIRAEYKRQFVCGDEILIKRATLGDTIQFALCDQDDGIRCIVEFTCKDR